MKLSVIFNKFQYLKFKNYNFLGYLAPMINYGCLWTLFQMTNPALINLVTLKPIITLINELLCASRSEIKRKESQMRDGDLSGIFPLFHWHFSLSDADMWAIDDLHIMHGIQIAKKCISFIENFPQKFTDSLWTSVPFHRF